MQTVILCGGKGTRLREYTETIPKPMVEIGSKPILWHLMKIYASHGFNEFILCLGYKGELIRDYFKNNDLGVKITFVDTGQETETGGRIKKIEPHIKDNVFFATYADGLADIDLNELLEHHSKSKKIATLTTVNPLSQFGVIEIDENDTIIKFKEKPLLNQWINGGFFVFSRGIFEYLKEDSVLEKEPFERLAADQQISAFKLKKFWKCMDTFKDVQLLNELSAKGDSPWTKK
ncbi:MAG TPA: sugar phosphate nucleotidyltransferase [Candidatus Nanoarchaeia archaeon]|nr:sugar phosphate nucleotidyltransferase [Candidatus Nanoarchaeia archaeon]